MSDISHYHEDNIESIPLPKSFYALLEAIRNRPALYLGHKSLSVFWPWLLGYLHARSEYCESIDAELSEFGEFDRFVCAKYDWDDVGGWAAKIRYYYRDEGDALDEFFRLFDEFRASRQSISDKPDIIPAE